MSLYLQHLLSHDMIFTLIARRRPRCNHPQWKGTLEHRKYASFIAVNLLTLSHPKRASQKGLICGAGLTIHTVSGGVIHITESEVTASTFHAHRIFIPLVGRGHLFLSRKIYCLFTFRITSCGCSSSRKRYIIYHPSSQRHNISFVTRPFFKHSVNYVSCGTLPGD